MEPCHRSGIRNSSSKDCEPPDWQFRKFVDNSNHRPVLSVSIVEVMANAITLCLNRGGDKIPLGGRTLDRSPSIQTFPSQQRLSLEKAEMDI